ncbi:MAG TPA: hypothetical protein PKK10_03460 [Woeseiaceae bacterium]|nr:hypothetical protein [Woeseiaceae bacterium]
MLDKLPDNCGLDDVQNSLYVIAKVQRGIQAANAYGNLSQLEAAQRVAKWTPQYASYLMHVIASK